MTFAEFVLLIGAVMGLYFAMKPLQRRLERRFYKFFRSRLPRRDGTIIDITDYSKKKDNEK